MLLALSIYDVMTLQSACTAAQWLAAENAGAAERCANNPNMPEQERAAADRTARWNRARAARFEAVCEVLKEGREITTLAQAKEALER